MVNYKPIYSVAEAAGVVGIGEALFRQLIKEKEIVAIRVNKALKVRGKDLEEFVNSRKPV